MTNPMPSQAGATNLEYGQRSANWVTAASYRDGAAWILDGARQSALLTPQEQEAPGEVDEAPTR